MSDKDKYDILLAFVHECGHAFMMHLLYEDKLLIDYIKAKPGDRPIIMPSNEFYDRLQNLDEQTRVRYLALFSLAGGALEWIITAPGLRFIYREFYALICDSHFLPKDEKEAHDIIFAGMKQDIENIDMYCNQYGLIRPIIETVFCDAVKMFLEHFNSNKDSTGNLFSLIDEIDSEYHMSLSPYEPEKGVYYSGEKIQLYFRGCTI